jgi:hypothetical protein
VDARFSDNDDQALALQALICIARVDEQFLRRTEEVVAPIFREAFLR